MGKWAASSVPATETRNANTLFHLVTLAGFKYIDNVVLCSALADINSRLFARKVASQVAVDRSQLTG